MASSGSSLRGTMIRTLTHFLNNHQLYIRRGNTLLISELLTDDCTHHIKPETIPDREPDLYGTREIYSDDHRINSPSLLSIFPDAEVSISELVVDPVTLKGSAYTEHTAHPPSFLRPVVLDFSWHVDFTDDGTKLSRIFEFVDSEAALWARDEFVAGVPRRALADS
ncbi:hypothetical protein F5Y05DRAFT_419447 [Hypoxylon sp. FL0543]|nr:hypothetical protein F5Y05DRAFT_419447 [Hypoxylon sp. FL0543]